MMNASVLEPPAAVIDADDMTSTNPSTVSEPVPAIDDVPVGLTMSSAVQVSEPVPVSVIAPESTTGAPPPTARRRLIAYSGSWSASAIPWAYN
jgi:uncharacterized protein (DUF3084 family)